MLASVLVTITEAVATAAKRLTSAVKNDAILKVIIVASALLASSGVGYYYFVYLPQRHAQLEPQRLLERFRATTEKRAEQELLLFEQKVSEQRAAEQKAAEERQALEKANRYQACLSRATDSYNTSRLAACNRAREKIITDQDDCYKLGFSRNVCAMAHLVPEASPNCTLPRTVRLALDADAEKARDRCLEEDKNGFAVASMLSSTQIKSTDLSTVIVEPVEPASPPPLSAPASASESTAMPSTAAARRAHAPEAAPEASAIVVDGNSGNLLYSAKSDELRHPASLTKIMTLYLLFERMEAGKFTLNSQLSVSQHASVQAPSKLGLRPGQTITVEDAIRAMVTKSANDVAVVVAEAIGGSEDEFANMMTKKAHALGMSRTVYRNASGLPNDGQLTTARDQALLGRAIQERFPRQYHYFSTPSFTYRGETMSNHNHLLGQVEGIDGIKTGYTQASGFNLVTSVHRNKSYIVAVVLGGQSAGARDARMRALIEAHIASASTEHTAGAITEIKVAKNAKAAAEAKTENWPAKATPIYTVASFAPQGAWPGPQFVPLPADGNVPPETALAANAPPSVAAAPLAKADGLPPAGESADAVEFQEAVMPVRVKTVRAKLARTAELGPAIVRVPEESDVLLQSPLPSSKTAPGTKGTAIMPGAEAPAAAASLPPKAMVYGFKPTTVPAASARVERQATGTGTSPAAMRDAKPFMGGQSSASHAGWIVQIGAFDIEREAQQRLSSARAKVGHVLDHAQSFTEAVSKGEKTLYRARLAGFQQKDDAEAACKQLKQNDFDCVVIKN